MKNGRGATVESYRAPQGAEDAWGPGRLQPEAALEALRSRRPPAVRPAQPAVSGSLHGGLSADVGIAVTDIEPGAAAGRRRVHHLLHHLLLLLLLLGAGGPRDPGPTRPHAGGGKGRWLQRWNCLLDAATWGAALIINVRIIHAFSPVVQDLGA